MAAEDLARDAFDPKKRYAAVRMQQGRVMTDDDYNEGARIEAEDERRSRLDIIGPAGTADDAFRPFDGAISASGQVDFEISPGTFYLGGLRVENPDVVHFNQQPDYLQQPAAERTSVGGGGVRDFLWLEAWQQPVTAVEDAELFEAALAGPDTSARVRTMWRVHRTLRLNPGVDDCADAWDDLKAEWVATDQGTLSPSFERVVDAELKITFGAGGPAGDLCTPLVAGGYLGAENQAIRVEIVDGQHFTWGFDNSAPLYRVQIAPGSGTVTFLTEPKDQAHWPMAGQIVEILPWSAVLSNREKLAELSGHLARVDGSYDPDSKQLTLTAGQELPVGFGEEWLTRPDAAELGPPGGTVYLFLRLWNRGSDVLSPPRIPIVAGPIALGNTGLLATFTGDDFVAGDHWIVAARPETPDRIVPWSLEVERAPHGVRRFFHPLAVIEWKTVGGVLTFDVIHDCRPTFLPLTRLQGCCTVTVGDGEHSQGQYDSIQKAVDNLPSTGGKVCVLPGEYAEGVTIEGRQNVIIEGCGDRTRIVPPQVADGSGFGIYIVDSTQVTIRSLRIEPGRQVGVVVRELPATPPDVSVTEDILIEEVSFAAAGLPAIAAWFGRRITVRRCRVLATLAEVLGTVPEAGRWPSIIVHSDDVNIEENELLSEPSDQYVRSPFGGVQIGGGSERVVVRRNRIVGGMGDGVTLGSWAWVPRTDFLSGIYLQNFYNLDFLSEAPGDGWVINIGNCVEIPWFPIPPVNPEDPLDPMVPASLGKVLDVRIVDNDISAMGRSGISIARFFDLATDDDFIVADRLTIENNRIHGCVQLPRSPAGSPTFPPEMLPFIGEGAIVLAAGELTVIRDNVIEQNGRSHVDPVCGIFALTSEGMLIDRNRIIDNAPRTATGDAARDGWRGGVVLTMARPNSTTVDTAIPGIGTILRQGGVPAARIHDNVIVVPEGRCIMVIGEGPMSIADNQLTSRGTGTASPILIDATTVPEFGDLLEATNAYGGCVALVMNFGRSNEFRDQLDQFLLIRSGDAAGAEGGPGLDPPPPMAAGGNILFDDNQATLDLLARGATRVFSSVFLLTADDAGATGNQLVIDSEGDTVKANIYLSGQTARLTGNRMTERIMVVGETDVLSAACFGFVASATSNVSSHCLVVVGAFPPVTLNTNNIVLAVPDAAGCAGAEVVAIDIISRLSDPGGHR